MSAFFWPPDNTRGRAVSLTTWGSGLILPLDLEPRAWVFYTSGQGLVSAPTPFVSGASGYGFVAAAADAASGTWMCQYASGSLYHMASGGAVTGYTLPANTVFTGCNFVSTYSGTAYAVSSSGSIYAPSGTGVASIGSFGSPPTWGLHTSGTTLLTLLAAASGIGTFALSSSGAGTSGFVSTPMPVPSCMAASTAASAIAVGGWGYAAFGSGYNQFAFDPGFQNVIGVSSGNNQISLYNGNSQVWTFVMALSGLGAPSYAAWAANGVTLMVSDPVSGRVQVITYSLSNIFVSQTLTVSGAGAVAIQPSSLNALVCVSGTNQVVPLAVSGTSWVSGSAVTGITKPQAVISTAVSGAAVGYASGVAVHTYNGATWSVTASAALPYVPSALTTDGSGNVYAAGQTAVSGYVTAFSGATAQSTVSWTGSGIGVAWQEGQTAVGDPSISAMRIFQSVSGTLSQANTAQLPTSGTFAAIAMGTQTLFASTTGASGTTWLYQWLKPWTLDRLRSGQASIYTSGSWASATLGINQWPMAVTFDASGVAWFATLQNTLFAVTSGGTIQSQTTIAQYGLQPSTTPIGTSKLLWWTDGHLYAASSLSGALNRIL